MMDLRQNVTYDLYFIKYTFANPPSTPPAPPLDIDLVVHVKVCTVCTYSIKRVRPKLF